MSGNKLAAQGRWLSPSTPAYSTSKTDRRDMTESGVKAQSNKQNHLLLLKTQVRFQQIDCQH